jgi:hypothetical protein
MSTPDLTPWGERLRERTAELAPDDAAYGYAHAHLAQALAKALERAGEIYDPDDGTLPGSPLVDVDRCPDWALPWLAQLIGVALPPDTSPDNARYLIRDVAGWRRGTPGAIQAAIDPLLTGGKTVFFRERVSTAVDPPYTLEIVTRNEETPNPGAVLSAILAQKPAGILLDYHLITGWDYQGLKDTGPDPYSALAASYPTYQHLKVGPP